MNSIFSILFISLQNLLSSSVNMSPLINGTRDLIILHFVLFVKLSLLISILTPTIRLHQFVMLVNLEKFTIFFFICLPLDLNFPWNLFLQKYNGNRFMFVLWMIFPSLFGCFPLPLNLMFIIFFLNFNLLLIVTLIEKQEAFNLIGG